MKGESGIQELKAAGETGVLAANLPAVTWKVSMTIPKFPTGFYQNNNQQDQTVPKAEGMIL